MDDFETKNHKNNKILRHVDYLNESNNNNFKSGTTSKNLHELDHFATNVQDTPDYYVSDDVSKNGLNRIFTKSNNSFTHPNRSYQTPGKNNNNDIDSNNQSIFFSPQQIKSRLNHRFEDSKFGEVLPPSKFLEEMFADIIPVPLSLTTGIINNEFSTSNNSDNFKFKPESSGMSTPKSDNFVKKNLDYFEEKNYGNFLKNRSQDAASLVDWTSHETYLREKNISQNLVAKEKTNESGESSFWTSSSLDKFIVRSSIGASREVTLDKETGKVSILHNMNDDEKSTSREITLGNEREMTLNEETGKLTINHNINEKAQWGSKNKNSLLSENKFQGENNSPKSPQEKLLPLLDGSENGLGFKLSTASLSPREENISERLARLETLLDFERQLNNANLNPYSEAFDEHNMYQSFYQNTNNDNSSSFFSQNPNYNNLQQQSPSNQSYQIVHTLHGSGKLFPSTKSLTQQNKSNTTESDAIKSKTKGRTPRGLATSASNSSPLQRVKQNYRKRLLAMSSNSMGEIDNNREFSVGMEGNNDSFLSNINNDNNFSNMNISINSKNNYNSFKFENVTNSNSPQNLFNTKKIPQPQTMIDARVLVGEGHVFPTGRNR